MSRLNCISFDHTKFLGQCQLTLGVEYGLTEVMNCIRLLLVTGLMIFMSCVYASDQDAVQIAKIAKNTHLNPRIVRLALKAYQYAALRTQVNKSILTIVDYSQPSVRKRLYVIDLKTDRLLMNTLVAHGRNTGDMFSTRFSNLQQSKESSVGVFITEGTYLGRHGKSMVINGLEKNINDNAKSRGLVVHSANYVSESFAEATGRIGRSFGCLAVNPHDLNQLITLTAHGSVIFSYAPQEDHDQVLARL